VCDDKNDKRYGQRLVYQVSETYYQDYPNIKQVPRMVINGCNYDQQGDIWELWKPKKGEWCWFWDSRNKIVHFKRFECMCPIVPTNYITIEGGIYSNCQPFIGELPITLYTIKDK